MYAHDGSAMSGVGNYVVQSLTLDSVQCVLPTFSIFTETRESLKELQIMTLHYALCFCWVQIFGEQNSGTNRLRHDRQHQSQFNSYGKCCKHFKSDSSPKSLVCNVHPLMMFQQKIKEVFQLLYDTLHKDRLVDCFLVDVDFAWEDFITKALKCLNIIH